ncbi:HAD-IB family hydrolase [Streptomyces sp. NBC_01166]|uniref:HAD family hydrolase n=1 Tax=Streptomyces sp. NBC_01166 TaxID=2903755 RepID=UPI00386E432E|nr:HAD-IB family hydrolase [Streptomyces sp. NBC_01166]
MGVGICGSGECGGRYLVFSDVDETLVGLKTMFDFLRFVSVPWYEQVADGIRALGAAGTPRSEVNRAYYRLWAGRSVEETERLGTEWYALRSAGADFFLPGTLAELARHRAAGAGVVLVSGSFPPCVTPIAAEVGAAHVLCTELLVENGTYTGEIREPVIGEGKRSAVRRTLRLHPGIDARDCYAYGDHVSDIPMFDCVGRSYAVGDDPALASYPRSPGAESTPDPSAVARRAGGQEVRDVGDDRAPVPVQEEVPPGVEALMEAR